MADVLGEQHPVGEAAREQLEEQPDDPLLALALHRREAMPEEVELEVRAAAADLEVVVERGVRVGVADDDPGRVDALLLEDPQLGQADRRQDGVRRDRQPGPPGGPRGGAVDPLLGRRQPRLVGPDLADDPGPDAASRRPRRSTSRTSSSARSSTDRRSMRASGG